MTRGEDKEASGEEKRRTRAHGRGEREVTSSLPVVLREGRQRADFVRNQRRALSRSAPK